MAKDFLKSNRPRTESQKEAARPDSATAVKDGECRCKETSRMAPRDLLKLMLNDLAFWRKGRSKQ